MTKFQLLILSGVIISISSAGQQPVNNNAVSNYQQVNTYVNPVLPGDHPDPTLLKVGNDFYHCGSSFHFTPYLPIYHSKDMVHWEIIGRGKKWPRSLNCRFHYNHLGTLKYGLII